MDYNINDIMPFVKNYNFNEYFTQHEEDFFISAIDYTECDNFDWEDGASKLVIIPENYNYVIKIPFNGCYCGLEYCDFSQNYCETEIELYETIISENPIFSQFFLPLTRVEEFFDYDIYIQLKCQVYNNLSNIEKYSFYSKESMKKAKSNEELFCPRLPIDWVAAVIEVLKDVNLVEEFFNVLNKYDITLDLHKGNIGYYNNKPIILDYAGFYD